MSALFATVLLILAVFLILLVLVQRGRGGGLTGALGGMGGSSAFGAKAGDVFTRITIVTATIWIAVCVAAVYWASHRADVFGKAGSDVGSAFPRQSSPSDVDQPSTDAPAGTADAAPSETAD